MGVEGVFEVLFAVFDVFGTAKTGVEMMFIERKTLEKIAPKQRKIRFSLSDTLIIDST